MDMDDVTSAREEIRLRIETLHQKIDWQQTAIDESHLRVRRASAEVDRLLRLIEEYGELLEDEGAA